MAEPTAEPIETQAVDALFHARRRIKSGVAPILESFGVTGSQMGLLKALERAEEVGWSQIELSRQIPTSKPNVTGLLKRLEAAELIARESEEVDGRVKRTRLTPKGRELLRQLQAPVEAAFREMASTLSDEEKTTLIALLNRLAPRVTNGEKLMSTAGDQRSAVSDQRSAISGQRSALNGKGLNRKEGSPDE